MKFMDMVWAAFLARQNPVSTKAKPACMNMTRNPVMRVHTMLMAILLWPTVARTSSMVGFFGSFTTSLADPVFSPVGSGTGAAAGAAAAGAGASEAGAWASGAAVWASGAEG